MCWANPEALGETCRPRYSFSAFCVKFTGCTADDTLNDFADCLVEDLLALLATLTTCNGMPRLLGC